MQQIRSRQTEQDFYLNFDDERLVNFTVNDFQTLYEAFIELFGEQKTFYFKHYWQGKITRNKLNGERELLEMIYYLASNATKQFSYNSLARIVEIKHPDTVKNYLEYIESTYLLSQVMRFDWSVKK